jgi:small-conductance mechanosensitive channel
VLTFALDIDPEQVRDILLVAYVDHPSVLDHPAPSVMFSQLTPDGITLSVTGYVRSPRIAPDIRSELLFAILKGLRAAEIPLSNPRTVVVQGLRHTLSGQGVSHFEPEPVAVRALSAVTETK